MRLLADENFRRDLVEWLRNQGHDVSWVVQECPGSSDQEIIERAIREDRMILSADLDFGELIVMHRQPAAGILILRLGALASEDILRNFQDQWPQIETVLTNHLVVMTPHSTSSSPNQLRDLIKIT